MDHSGNGFLYSGGGYLILQRVAEELTKVRFAEYAASNVLDPAGMIRSTYHFLSDQNNASPSFHVDGSIAPTYKYASATATSLASDIGLQWVLWHTGYPGFLSTPSALQNALPPIFWGVQ